MSNPIRIAMLECDPLTPSINAKHGSYGDVVTAFLEAGAKRLGLPMSHFELRSWNIMDNAGSDYPDAESIDAVVITGSSKRNEKGVAPFKSL